MTSTASEVPLERLSVGYSPRGQLLDRDHARALAEAGNDLPPIIVQSSTMKVIDGGHRVLAAKMLGRSTIRAVFFEGTDAEAFAEAVRHNVSHGKPLSMREREDAARRLIALQPDWSDRRLAHVCGLSPKTVARYRCSTVDGPQLSAREGRDGKRRPVDPSSKRALIADHLRQNPGASLRSVAKSTGSSQATVHDVRQRLQRGDSPIPGRAEEQGPGPGWSEDAALTSTDLGTEFAEWFERSAISDEQWAAFVDGLPLSRTYMAIDEARHRAKSWARFADSLEGRTRNVR